MIMIIYIQILADAVERSIAVKLITDYLQSVQCDRKAFRIV